MTKTAQAHLVQYIGRVVGVPVDEKSGDAEDAGSCCTKCYSDVDPFTDVPPDGVAAIAIFKHRHLKTLLKVMTQEVKVPVAGLPRVLRRSVHESRGAD